MPVTRSSPRHRPLLSQSSRPLTFTVDAVNEHGQTVPMVIAGEHPLTIYVDRQELVTLMTLGAAPEALVLGYLRNQRLIDDLADIAAVQVDWEVNAAAVITHSGEGLVAQRERLARHMVTTGCGQGTMLADLLEELDAMHLDTHASSAARLSEAQLYALLDAVRQHESIYKQAGAVHGCALTRPAVAGVEIISFVEDVGRHNAVDTIAGQMWLNDETGSDKVFYTTGRLTSEMVIKTAQMGIPFLVSRSGLTQMGWELAVKLGMTLIGRAQGKHYLVLAGTERFTR